MSAKIRILLTKAIVVSGMIWCPPWAVVSEESIGQMQAAYAELSRLQALSTPGLTYQNYREAVTRAREEVALLRDESNEGDRLLRSVMAYHEQALAVWKLQADSDAAVDSLRNDEAVGAAIVAQCPDVPRFHYKWREQIYVQDAVACLWNKAAEELRKVPGHLY